MTLSFRCYCTAVTVLCSPSLLAQNISTTPPLPTLANSTPTFTLIVRERTNANQWFSATPKPEVYGYQDSLVRLGVAQRVHQWDYQLELSQSAEFGLPDDAVLPAPQGQLGLGGTYYFANNNQDPAAASLKQAFLRYHFSQDHAVARLGRFEFFDGQETTPSDTTLAWLQANRIVQRLVGNFGFSNGLRSFDGADLKLASGSWDLTAMAGRADQGVWNMNANPELNVDIQYLAYTRALAQKHVLVRGFALGYHDGRTGITKTDNRPAAVRAADHRNIRLGTYGANVTAAVPVGDGVVLDGLFWGALQNGQWGTLGQHAGSFAAEGGVRLAGVATKPWLRAGFTRSTGDNNPTDGANNTFFQVLPTPRVYARFPFFNMMNNTDRFVQLIDTPRKGLELRADLHGLQLTAPNDLWYGGGGAYDNTAFGFTSRPSGGHASFSGLADISADWTVGAGWRLGLYYGQAIGRRVVRSDFPDDQTGQFGFLEVNYRWGKTL